MIPLLATKSFIPPRRPRDSVIDRSRLTDHLLAMNGQRLTLVSAPTPSANPLYVTLVRLGILRLFGQSLLTGLQPAAVHLPEDVRPTYISLTGRLKALQAWANEEAGLTQDDAILEANTSLGDKPLAVLVSTQGITNNDRWQKAQEMMATYSSNSRMQVVPDSEHMLQWQYPEEVTATVVDVIESVRTSQPLASQ